MTTLLIFAIGLARIGWLRYKVMKSFNKDQRDRFQSDFKRYELSKIQKHLPGWMPEKEM